MSDPVEPSGRAAEPAPPAPATGSAAEPASPAPATGSAAEPAPVVEAEPEPTTGSAPAPAPAPAPRRRSPYDVGAPRDDHPDPDAPPARPRPILERVGMAAIALVLGALFALVGIAAFLGGEPFLGVMGVIGTLMVLWVGGLTLFKGR
jgi:hypothetical protein